MSLKDNFETACNAYIGAFITKQEFDVEHFYWTGVGEIAHFQDEYSFDLVDIRHDIDTDQPKYKIIEWHNYWMDEYWKNEAENLDKPFKNELHRINYKSYCSGARY